MDTMVSADGASVSVVSPPLVAVGGTAVAVGGTAVAVGGTAVAVGGTAVAVGGTAVAVGGTAVAVGGTAVAVGGTAVAVGGTAVAVGGTAVAVGSPITISEAEADAVSPPALAVTPYVPPRPEGTTNVTLKPPDLLVLKVARLLPAASQINRPVASWGKRLPVAVTVAPGSAVVVLRESSGVAARIAPPSGLSGSTETVNITARAIAAIFVNAWLRIIRFLQHRTRDSKLCVIVDRKRGSTDYTQHSPSSPS
jgi:hypothetical protein